MKRPVVALGLVAIAAALYFVFFRSSDEERIKDQLARLAKTVSVSEEQKNPITRAAHLRSELAEIFEKDVRASIPELGSARVGRDALVELALTSSAMVRTVRVEITNVEIKIDDASKSAHVKATARLRGTMSDGQDKRDERALDLQLTRREGDWRIASLTVWSKDDASPR
jgi:hypothetical protein